MHVVRQPAVAGTFYPGDQRTLSGTVASLLAGAQAEQASGTTGPTPKVLVVPHAGYIYSGVMAARGYARLASAHGIIRRVVLLGPAHRVRVRGLALPGSGAFASPLGEVAIDPQAAAALTHLPQVVVNPAAHAQEHALEVQLPFLQMVLDEFTLVPLAVGDASAEEVAEVLEALWGGPETLIVISSDLSHYLPYRMAQDLDRNTVERILALQGPLTHEQACGGTPLNGLLLSARRHSLQPELLGLCNSGDTAGDRQRVVGYAAIAFSEAHHGRH